MSLGVIGACIKLTISQLEVTETCILVNTLEAHAPKEQSPSKIGRP